MHNHKAVIMAGGRGTRLWPVSRTKTPKQFQAIVSDKTMLQETFERLRLHYDAADIYISTNTDSIDEVKKELPEITEKQIIAEPISRNTASCMALITEVIHKHDPESSVAVYSSDAYIGNPEELVAGIQAGEAFLADHKDYTVTFGIVPTRPEVGYGYIKKAEELLKHKDHTVYEAAAFVEKPDFATAKTYLADGGYYWNPGIFMFDTSVMCAKFEKLLPDTSERAKAIVAAENTEDYDDVLMREYSGMEDISVDFAIMEKDENVAVIPLQLNWSDVGSWASLKETLVEEKEAHLSRGEHVDLGSKNLMVYGHGDKLVKTMGLEDVIIVDTEDALLVCSMEEAGNLSKAVKGLDDKYKKLL